MALGVCNKCRNNGTCRFNLDLPKAYVYECPNLIEHEELNKDERD